MTERDCDRVDDRGAWVLGALEEEEAARFAAHLESCRFCRDEVSVMQRAADALVDVVVPAQAPPQLEAELMRHVREEASLSRAASAPPEVLPVPERRMPRLLAAAAVVAALAAGAGGFAAGRWSAGDPAPPSARTERLIVLETEARATLRREPGDRAILTFDELGPPARGRVYQVWLRRPDRPLASTNRLFSVSDGGQAVVVLPQLDGVEEIVLTAEPQTGSESPTLPPVAVVVPAGRSRF